MLRQLIQPIIRRCNRYSDYVKVMNGEGGDAMVHTWNATNPSPPYETMEKGATLVVKRVDIKRSSAGKLCISLLLPPVPPPLWVCFSSLLERCMMNVI